MDRTPSSVHGGPDRHGDVLGNTFGRGDLPCSLCDRRSDPDLIEFLHSPAAKISRVCRAGDVDHRGLGVRGVCQAGNGVGVPGGGGQHHPRPSQQAGVCVCHVDGRLLVAGVDHSDRFVDHHVEQVEYVIACNAEDGINPLGFQGIDQQVTAGSLNHMNTRSWTG